MRERRAKRSEAAPRQRSSRRTIALALAWLGAALVVVAILMGLGERGISTATGIHIAGVLAMVVAGILTGTSLLRFARADSKGWPIVGLLALGFLIATGWLVQRARLETRAGRLWDELTDLATSEEPAVAMRLMDRFDEIPASEPRLRARYLKRLGELRDGRAAPFLRKCMREHPEAAVRLAAARAFGTLAGQERIDLLVDELRKPGDHRPTVEALKAATGADHGDDHRAWSAWRMGQLLETGTPESIRAVLRRLGAIGSGDEALYRQIRDGLRSLTDPALRPVFEEALREDPKGSFRLDRRGTLVVVLGRLGDPTSVAALRGAFAWSRTAEEEKKITPEDADAFRGLVGASLRRIAGEDVLDDERWAPVFGFFLDLLGDGEALARRFGERQLERMTKARLGLDRAAWERWREDRAVAAWAAAGKIGPLVLDLRRRVGEKDIERSARTIRALAGMADDRARKAVRAIVLQRSAEPRIRTIALDALAGAEATTVLSKADLLRLLEQEEDVAILRSVVAALVAHDEDPIVRSLHERYLVEEEDVVRRAIVDALRRMTADAVFEALVDAVRDEVPAIQEGAADELEKRSGKRYGVDADKWAEWFRRTFDK